MISYVGLILTLAAVNCTFGAEREFRLGRGFGTTFLDNFNLQPSGFADRNTGQEFTPHLSVGVTYSDNINLQPPGFEENDVVTSVSPGFSLRHKGNRLDLDIDYTMENLFYDQHDEANTTNHQLLGRSKLELIRDYLFLEADGSITQAVIDPQQNTGTDTLSITNNFTDVYTYRISPVLRHDFGHYVDGELRFGYSGVRTQDDATEDTDTRTISARIAQGRQFHDLEWELSYFNEIIDRKGKTAPTTGVAADTTDSHRENLLGRVDYQLNDRWALVGQAGYENNDLGDNTIANQENGAFWSAGVRWTPSRILELTALYGPDDEELGIRFAPTPRTQFALSRRDRTVGTNPGVTWFGSLEHRTQFSQWSARYTDETISGSDLLGIQPISTTASDGGEGNPPSPPLQVVAPFTLTTGEINRKRFEASMVYEKNRTRVALNGFDEKRLLLDDGTRENLYGFGLEIGRRLGSHMSSTLFADWTHEEFDVGRKDEIWSLQTQISYNFNKDISTGLIYRYIQRDSTEAEEEYQENRIGIFSRLEF